MLQTALVLPTVVLLEMGPIVSKTFPIVEWIHDKPLSVYCYVYGGGITSRNNTILVGGL